ncbi:MAG: SDR family NAD(P)-dependent oxidoreductase [Bdellovibrionia bacterium]
MSKLAGKVAVITGGSTGMGLATAKRFVDEGAYVFITGRRQSELDHAVQFIGKNVTAVQGDVSKTEDLDRLYQAVKEKKGRLDIVFANAGIGELAPLGDITEQHYSKIFDVNVKGLLFTVQKALPLLRDGSAIILNASIAGYTGTEGFSVYSASKAAVRAFARSWMLDLKPRKIRVNVLSPGPIDTPIFSGLGDPEKIKQFKDMITAEVPLGRMGNPVEIGSVATFLASDESSFVNGAELTVDGGLAQH